MFTQKQLSEAFGVTPQSITIALRGVRPIERYVEQTEGSRVVRRAVKSYGPDAAFRIAVRTGKLPAYQSLCAANDIPHETFNITRAEIDFGESLRRFLPPNIEIAPQFRIDGYSLDFYLPDYGIAVEYDERHHETGRQSSMDALRQNHLENIRKIRFVRVKQGQEEAGLFSIAKIILAA